MSQLMFTIVAVAKHPAGQHTTNTYQVTSNNRYQAIDQVIDSIHSYGLTVVSWDILDSTERGDGGFGSSGR